MVLLVAAADAVACSLAPNPTLTVDVTLADGTPPAAPTLVAVDITRGRGPTGFLEKRASSFDDLGFIDVTVARPDGDSDSDDDVGYRMTLVGGTLPTGLSLPAADGDPWLGPDLFLSWIDEATNRQDAFAFSLGLTPVDAAGNEGEMLVVEIADDGRAAGCNTTGAGAAGSAAAGLLGFALRRRARTA